MKKNKLFGFYKGKDEPRERIEMAEEEIRDEDLGDGNLVQQFVDLAKRKGKVYMVRIEESC